MPPSEEIDDRIEGPPIPMNSVQFEEAKAGRFTSLARHRAASSAVASAKYTVHPLPFARVDREKATRGFPVSSHF